MKVMKFQKAALFGNSKTQKIPTTYLTAFCVSVGFGRMTRQSSPKMSTPPASREPPSFIGLRLIPHREDTSFRYYIFLKEHSSTQTNICCKK